MSTLVWLRRDLRVHDQPALHAALAEDADVVPVFCFDRRLLAGRHSSGPRARFLLECLADLERTLSGLGGGLVLRDSPPERVLPSLARRLGARRVLASADVGPYARRQEARVATALARAGASLELLPGNFVIEDLTCLTSTTGGRYTVFSAYHRVWCEGRRRTPLVAPTRMPALPRSVATESLPTAATLGLGADAPRRARGGERAGRRRLARFLRRDAHAYAQHRDRLDLPATSALSPYLHFGCLSAREVEARLPEGAGAQELRRQLCWRDFYAQLMLGFPRNVRSELRRRDAPRWSHARLPFAAWCDGRTGFPLVDAAMRQLLREGWMHNRARLVAASFLTKDLGIDWRWGERWFMRLLVDGDEASNNGNWQWVASVGADRAPPARRIFNPARQQRRFDPDGSYVRCYVPELARVPLRHLAEPWTMTAAMQRDARCVIGRDYPGPIVDHALARAQTLARFAQARDEARARARGTGAAAGAR